MVHLCYSSSISIILKKSSATINVFVSRLYETPATRVNLGGSSSSTAISLGDLFLSVIEQSLQIKAPFFSSDLKPHFLFEQMILFSPPPQLAELH